METVRFKINIRILFKFKIIILFLILHLTAIGFGQASSTKVLIGAAYVDISPPLGCWIQAAGVAKKAEKIRDALEANALFIAQDDFKILWISCDLVGIDAHFTQKIRKQISSSINIPERNILISSTHTHGGPSLLKTNYLMPVDTAYLDQLERLLVTVSMEAVNNTKPGKMGWGKSEVPIGFNRRLTWLDGSHTMHGDAQRTDFAGLEGPDDHQYVAIFFSDLEGTLLSVIYHNTTHPTTFYGDGVISADFPGMVRSKMRDKLNRSIPILYLNGAQGDISMQNMLDRKRESDEEIIDRISQMIVDANWKLLENLNWIENPVLKHDFHDLKVGVRLPSASELEKARQVLHRIDQGENIRGMEMIMAFGAVHLQETFEHYPHDILPIHGIRLDDLALVTQPCELYCQFGLDIKHRSPAKTTAVVGLTDGYGGYCPTIYGLLGGGYSGAPISWTRLEPKAGYLIVEKASQIINTLW